MEKTYGLGEIIIREGELDKIVYSLKSGKLGVLKSGRLIAEIENPGAIFGEIGVILNRPRSATVKALTPCVVDLVYANGINELVKVWPHVVRLGLRTLAKRLAETTNRLCSHMFDRNGHEITASDAPIASFRNVTRVDDRIIRRVVTTASNDDMVAALLGATPRVRDKFFKNMSARKAAMIKQDMRIATRICTQRAIKSAEQQILEMVNRLISSGI